MKQQTKSQTQSSRQDVSSLLGEIQRTHQVRRMALDATRRARLETQTRTRALNSKRNIGGKISMVGLALILCPDPFSDVVGVPLFVLGKLVKRVDSPLILADVFSELKSTMQAVNQARRM